jgi:hypothetical protein
VILLTKNRFLFVILKIELQAGVVVQVESACLASTRPWVQTLLMPPPSKKSTNKTLNYYVLKDVQCCPHDINALDPLEDSWEWIKVWEPSETFSYVWILNAWFSLSFATMIYISKYAMHFLDSTCYWLKSERKKKKKPEMNSKLNKGK